MARDHLVALLFGAWIAGAGTGCARKASPAAAGPRPNILLITLDTVRADHLGCYGYGRATSPAIDALAGRGVLFENAISQSAVTPVSHASILTGLLPYHHELRSLHGGAGSGLPADRLTLAEICAANGYGTAGFSSAFPTTKHYGLDQGFAHWDQDFTLDPEQPPINARGIVNTARSQRRADATTRGVLGWLNEPAGDRPFFCWVHYFDPHDPILRPPDAFLERFAPASDAKPDRLRAIYDAEISFVDAQIQAVLDKLDERGLLDNTVIAILADHGQGLGDHHWWGHCILYQEQIHVPFILVLPNRTPPQRVATMVRTIDLVPTLCEACGLTPPPGTEFDGVSLLDLIGGHDTAPGLAYAETINDLAAYEQSPLRNDSIYALSDGRWKFVLRREKDRDKQALLFDLEADPGEHRNVAARKPELVTRYRNHLEKLGALLDNPPRPALDEATRARLRELGYAGGK